MCGRFVQSSSTPVLARLLGLEVPARWPSRYNLAPTEEATAAIWQSGAATLVRLLWGMIATPRADSAVAARLLINARSETVSSHSTFRRALARHRAVIPADAFYEWSGPANRRQPWLIRPVAGHGALFFAAIWQPTGSSERRFALITRPATGVLRRLHHRMPAMLAAGAVEGWIAPRARPEALVETLCRQSPPDLEFYRVSREVNRAGPDHPGLMEPATDSAPSLFD
ncbi:MAG TPA: SOS response-associated peptidase [Acidobacteria bacterium]|nr:SOS response-associated peptidase [Acidobacteriota bacterium]